jgi:hypothetical protein
VKKIKSLIPLMMVCVVGGDVPGVLLGADDGEAGKEVDVDEADVVESDVVEAEVVESGVIEADVVDRDVDATAGTTQVPPSPTLSFTVPTGQDVQVPNAPLPVYPTSQTQTVDPSLVVVEPVAQGVQGIMLHPLLYVPTGQAMHDVLVVPSS